MCGKVLQARTYHWCVHGSYSPTKLNSYVHQNWRSMLKICNRSHVKLITTSCQIISNYTVSLNLEHQENWVYNYFHKELKPKFFLPPKNERGVEWSKTSLLIVYYPYSISILRAKKIISIFKRHFKLIQAGTQNNCFTPTVYSI